MKGDVINSIHRKNHFERYLNYAVSVIEKYKCGEPFHLYLKKYFSQNKKHGSKDRKQISSLCYHYFRIGNAVNTSTGIKEKILIATFLLTKESSPVLKEYQPDWEQWIQLSLAEKIEKISSFFSLEKLFPFEDELSGGIDFFNFNFSFLIQPKLFMRIRPGKNYKVFNDLKTAGIFFEKVNEHCVAFAQNESLKDILKIDKDVVIQDYNSQRVTEFFLLDYHSEKRPLKVWDCCAASGGKSILAFDNLKNISLTVSDRRKGILDNLKSRFNKAGIKNYQSFVADLSVSPLPEKADIHPDFIIADVPCSGSGTWARTPEQLLFFPLNKIEEYTQLQKQIVINAEKNLTENGYLLYITCSVFKKENEENVDYFEKDLNLLLIKSGYLEGYEMQADTLFAALFKKKLV